MTVGLVYASTLFGVHIAPSAVPAVALSVVLTAVAMVGFGLLLGGVALYLRTSIILGNIFLFVGLLLSGVNFPLSQLPLPLQYAGDALPLTWGVAAIRASVSGDPLFDAAGPVGSGRARCGHHTGRGDPPLEVLRATGLLHRQYRAILVRQPPGFPYRSSEPGEPAPRVGRGPRFGATRDLH